MKSYAIINTSTTNQRGFTMTYTVLRSWNNAPWYEVAGFVSLLDAKEFLKWYSKQDKASYKIIQVKN